jgi:hypothetical protein
VWQMHAAAWHRIVCGARRGAVRICAKNRNSGYSIGWQIAAAAVTALALSTCRLQQQQWYRGAASHQLNTTTAQREQREVTG